MLLLKTDARPPDAARWDYQLKLDGYRAVAFHSGGKLRLRSPNDRALRLVIRASSPDGQEFVIGGYTHGTKVFDALVFGVYDTGRLIYVARTRNGFTPTSRAALFKKSAGLEISECPFANLPEPHGGRWGQGLTKAKMAECVWLKPVLVAQIEFLRMDRREPSAAFEVRRPPGGQESE